jgi:hypothetical protein
MNFKAQVLAVVLITTLLTSAVFAVLHRYRAWFLADRSRICWVSAAWVLVTFVTTTVLALTLPHPAKGLFSAETWYSAGWRTGLSVFSIRIDAWWSYAIVINYQIIRSILGSMLTNFFRSYLLVSVQAGGDVSGKSRPSALKLVAAQAVYDIFVYYSSLTDTFLLLAQADMTLITLVATVLTDSVSTLYFLADPLDGAMVEGASRDSAAASEADVRLLQHHRRRREKP